MKHPPINKETQMFYTLVFANKQRFPYWAETTTSHPRPELIQNNKRGKFGVYVRIPLASPTFDIAVWGFETYIQRDGFITAYDAKVWTP